MTIEGAFGNHQVDVGILPAAPAEGHRIGQPFPSGECGGEASGEGPLLGRVQFLRQRALHCDKQPPVDPFVCVRGGPIVPGIVCGPLRHVPALAVSERIAVFPILPFPCDVLGPGARRLPAVTASGLHIQVIDSHRVPSARPGSSSAISVRSPCPVSLAEAMRPRPRPFAALRVLSSMRSPETVFASSSPRCQKDFSAITRLHSGACSSLHAAVISSTAPPSSTIRPVRSRVPASARARAHGSTLREIESPSGPGRTSPVVFLFLDQSFRLFGELLPGKSRRVRPQMIHACSIWGWTPYRASPETLPPPFSEGEGSDGSIVSESEGAGEV